MSHITIKPKFILAGVTVELTPEQTADLILAIPALDAVGDACIGASGLTALQPVSRFLHDLAESAGGLAWPAPEGMEPGGTLGGVVQGEPAPAVEQCPGPQPPTSRRATRPVQVAPDWLRQQYVDLEYSTTEIGRSLGCSSSTVSALLKRYGIPARPRGLHGAAPNPQTGGQ